VRVTLASPLVADSKVGAVGLAGGPAMLCNGTVAATTVATPLPAMLLGVTRNCTWLPASAGVGAQRCSVEVVADDKVVHVVPPSELISTRYTMVAVSPGAFGAPHATVRYVPVPVVPSGLVMVTVFDVLVVRAVTALGVAVGVTEI
jgi:hypothetical protein